MPPALPPGRQTDVGGVPSCCKDSDIATAPRTDYTEDARNAGGGTLLAQGAFTSGSTTFKVDNPQEVDTIVIRVTQLPKNSDPTEFPYKATVTEVTIK